MYCTNLKYAEMNELRPKPVWAGSARFTPVTTFIKTLHPSVALLPQKWMLEGILRPGFIFLARLRPQTAQNRKSHFFLPFLI